MDSCQYEKLQKSLVLPYGTMQRKYKNGANKKRPGGQTRLTDETESLIVELISALTNWRVPLDSFDVRCLVKGYLDKIRLRSTFQR